MMVDADLAAAAGPRRQVTVDAHRVRHRHHRSGRQLPHREAAGRGRRGARPRARRRRAGAGVPRQLPGGRAARRRPGRPGRRRRDHRRSSSRTRSTTWPASARSPCRGSSRCSPRRSPASAPAAVLEAAWQLQQRSRTAGARAAGLERRDLRLPGRGARRPRRRRSARARPYGAAKAFAHHLVGVYRGARAARRRRCILYNHESPRRPADVRHPQDHPGGGRRSPPASRTSCRSAPSTCAATGAGRPTTSTRCAWRSATSRPTTTSIATGESHTIADFVAAAFAHVGIADWAELRAHRRPVRPARPTRPSWSAIRPRRARELGWKPTVDVRASSWPAWSTPTCARPTQRLTMRVAVVVEQLLSPVPGGTGRYAAELTAALARTQGAADEVSTWTAWHRDLGRGRGPRRRPAAPASRCPGAPLAAGLGSAASARPRAAPTSCTRRRCSCPRATAARRARRQHPRRRAVDASRDPHRRTARAGTGRWPTAAVAAGAAITTLTQAVADELLDAPARPRRRAASPCSGPACRPRCATSRRPRSTERVRAEVRAARAVRALAGHPRTAQGPRRRARCLRAARPGRAAAADRRPARLGWRRARRRSPASGDCRPSRCARSAG